MLLSQWAFPAVAAPAVDGTTFAADELWNKFGDDLYYTEKNFEKMFHTVEAWVYFDSTCSTANGVLLGNYDQSGTTINVNVGVQAGHPRVNYIDGAGNSYNVRFDNVSVINGKWTHVVWVNNPETHQLSCYIDGELAETKGFFPDFDERSAQQAFVVGGDLRRLNTDYFKGGLKELNVYADVRSAEEIKNDYLTAKVDADADLLASWDFSEGKKDIADRGSYSNDLTYSNQWLTKEEVDAIHGDDFERAYSFAVVGDTQMVTLHAPAQLAKIYDWILEKQQEENIQYVIGLGDITDKNSETEWNTAYDAITRLDGKVPYSLVRGNHDTLKSQTGNVHDQSGVDYFNQLFLKNETFAGQYTGANGGKYEADSLYNTWSTFTPAGSDVSWLFLNLDFAPAADVLNWASGIIEAHPNHKVILSTHYFVDPSGSITNTAAAPIWETLASKYENIELVLSGHVYSDHVKVTQYEGANGNTVNAILVNPQGPDRTLTGAAYNTTGVGAVALFHFNKEGTEIQVEYYSAIQERYWKTNSQMTIDLTAEATRPTRLDTWNGQLSEAPAGSGTAADPYLVESAANLLWMSEQITKKSGASLANKYFKQTADIDLAGIGLPSIGWYYNSTTDMAAFGGHYDGQGYAIKNGPILSNSAAYDAASFSREYGYGLFGCIYGATVENVHLENVTVNGMGTTGGIVGKAAAPSNGSGTAAFNTIKNCSVDADCSIAPVMNTLTVNEEVAYDNLYRAGMVGGICGIARSATIQNCASAMEIVVPGTFTHVGGVVASAGYNTLVDHCVFTGSIEVMDDSSAKTLSIGGIMGLVSPIISTSDVGDALTGTIKITNCVNRGTLFTSVDDLTAASHWGGILGYAGNLPTLSASDPFVMQNCYNLTALDVQPHLETKTENAWARGLIGKGQVTDNKTESIFLTDCYSVLTESGVEANAESLSNTNEFRNQWAHSVTGNYCVVAVDGTVGTKSAGEMLAAVKEIEKALPNTLETVVSGDWEYTENEKGITLVAYKGTATDPEIPAQLDGKAVTTLGEGLFLNTPLTALYIPDSIAAIEMGAFFGTGMKEVTVPKTATLGADAFDADATVEIVNIAGDVNGDNTTDLIDALLLLRKMSGNLTAEQEASFNLRAANVYDANDADNEVNSADVIQMLRVLSGAWENGSPVKLTRSAAEPTFISVN